MKTIRRTATASLLGLLFLGTAMLQSCIYPHPRVLRPRHLHHVRTHPKPVVRVVPRPRVVAPRPRVRTINVRVSAPVPR